MRANLFDLNSIEILNLSVYYDDTSYTKTRETANMLQYESQHFKCKAHLKFKSSFAEDNWSIGLVQACDYMYLENRYGTSGSSFWEFHPLKSRRHLMVNDSDGRQYPFYSRINSKCEVRKGVLNETNILLHYDDHFYPTVAWDLPQCNSDRLTDVFRVQNFWVWLVAIKRGKAVQKPNSVSLTANSPILYTQFNPNTDIVYVMKTMRWRYNLHMNFDPKLPVGHRLVKIDDKQKEQPYICKENRGLPLSALCGPHCNAGQSLIWYPAVTAENRYDKPRLLVPPYQIVTNWTQWCAEMANGAAPRCPYHSQSPAYGVSYSDLFFAAKKPKDCIQMQKFPSDLDKCVGYDWSNIKSHRLPGKLISHRQRSYSTTNTPVKRNSLI